MGTTDMSLEGSLNSDDDDDDDDDDGADKGERETNTNAEEGEGEDKEEDEEEEEEEEEVEEEEDEEEDEENPTGVYFKELPPEDVDFHNLGVMAALVLPPTDDSGFNMPATKDSSAADVYRSAAAHGHDKGTIKPGVSMQCQQMDASTLFQGEIVAILMPKVDLEQKVSLYSCACFLIAVPACLSCFS